MRLKDPVNEWFLRAILLERTLVELVGRFARLVLGLFGLLGHSLISIFLLKGWENILFSTRVSLIWVLGDGFKLLTLRCVDHVLLNEACLLVLNFRSQFVYFSLIFAEISAVERFQGLKPNLDLRSEVEVVLSTHCEHGVDRVFDQIEMLEVRELND